MIITFLDKFSGFHTVTLYDRAGGVHSDVEVPDAGDAIEVPQDMPQSAATYESEDVSWGSGTTQAALNSMWNSQEKPHSDEHWAYITVGGQERYMVALVPTYGLPGDYVDIYVTNNGTETVYPCIIGDSKDIWVDVGYSWTDGVVYGHESGGQCNIVEVMSELSNNSSDWPIIGGTGLLDRLKGVTKIVNGGNISQYPDGPVGLDGNYNTKSNGSVDSESGTIAGAIGSLFRSFWVFLSTVFDNLTQGRDDATVLYSFKDDEEGSDYSISPGGIQTQEEATELQNLIEQQWLHTQVHSNGEYQNGPFAKYWSTPYNLLTPFQCTWWANGRASMYLELYGTKYKKYPTQMGNGGEYYAINQENGWFEYGQTPRPNSIISWSGGSGYGHVAYVEGVTTDGIWISDAGSGKSWRGVHKIGLDGHEFDGYSLNGYIYLDSPK